MPSLFGRMARYPPRLQFNPKENQHTEALAAVLEADPELARKLAGEWLDIKPHHVGGPARMRTQVPARGLERVDLELRFGPVGYPDRIVWVEVKVDSDLSSDDQLKRYWKALLRLPARAHALVLLQRWDVHRPSRELLPVDWCPSSNPALVRTDWQIIARLLAEAPTSGLARDLVGHFLAYLREGNMAMTDSLQSHHLVALERYWE